MKRMDTCRIGGEGYDKLVSFESWRLAKLRWEPRFEPENLAFFERHMATDEAFLLYEGEAFLLTGGDGDTPQDVGVVKMEMGVVYNFPKGAWHQILCSRDATVIIVENEDTSEENSEYVDFTPAQKQAALAQVRFSS